ncbi:MAG: prephenate dehydratase [Culicoidibacterales bacterium]
MSNAVIKYLGPIGSYTYEVALAFKQKQQLEHCTFMPFTSITAIFENSSNDDQNVFLVIPLENSTSGDVYETYRNLYTYNFSVFDIMSLEIRHVLIGLTGTTLADIKTVYSHPQALIQVTDYTTKQQLETRPYFSTAQAVDYISQENDPTLGAIASQTVANYYYNTEVIDINVSNNRANYTRFLILQAQEKPQAKSFLIKPSLVSHQQLFLLFELGEDRSGLLSDVLTVISQFDINLTSIKSRPIEGALFEYFFVVEARVDPIISTHAHLSLFQQLSKLTKKIIYNVY